LRQTLNIRRNYIIARYWAEYPQEGNRLSAYTLMNSQVFYGTEEEAEEMREHVEKKQKNSDFKVFWIDENEN